MGIYVALLGVTMLIAWFWRCAECQLAQEIEGDFRVNAKQHQIHLLKRNFWIAMTFFPLYIFNAGMYYVGNDYVNYVKEFDKISNGGLSQMDIAYVWLNKLVIHLGLSFQFVLVFLCLAAYILFFICIHKYSENYPISFLLYFIIGYFFLLNLNQIRQWMALMLVMLAYQYIEKKRVISYMVLIAFATMFHFTAIIMVLFYFVLSARYKLSVYIVLMLILAPFNLFYNQLLRFLFATFRPSYIGSAYMDKTLQVDMFMIVAMFSVLMMILFYYDTIVVSRIQTIFMNAFFVALLLTIFCGWIPEVTRFTYYFYLPMIFLVPNTLLKEKRQSQRFIWLVAIVGLHILRLLRSAGGWGLVPYDHIWLH